jgi:hypothetical protein
MPQAAPSQMRSLAHTLDGAAGKAPVGGLWALLPTLAARVAQLLTCSLLLTRGGRSRPSCSRSRNSCGGHSDEAS